MRTDGQIKQDILDELVFQPNIDETQIGVIVENGTVTLTGFVDDFQKKVTAEEVVKKINGVKALAADIQVKYGDDFKKTDKEIAKAIVKAYEWNTSIPENQINIEVRDGWVNISGEVEWHYQREAANRVAGTIMGVKGINNTLNIKKSVEPSEIKNKIKNTFKRMADLNTNNIVVDVDGSKVRLQGKVNSLTEKENAQSIAYKTPGVLDVLNELEVIGITKHIIYDEFDD